MTVAVRSRSGFEIADGFGLSVDDELPSRRRFEQAKRSVGLHLDQEAVGVDDHHRPGQLRRGNLNPGLRRLGLRCLLRPQARRRGSDDTSRPMMTANRDLMFRLLFVW